MMNNAFGAPPRVTLPSARFDVFFIASPKESTPIQSVAE
jgi:hypothetical protein